MSVLTGFYRWASAEQHATAEPFTYRSAVVSDTGQAERRAVNTATRRRPKDHVTRYLEADFADLFLTALAGLGPDGDADPAFRGWNITRNAAIGRLALSTGLRLQEFSSLLAYELPPLLWRPPAKAGPPLVITEADAQGGRVNGQRMRWDTLRPAERLRLLSRTRFAVAGGALDRWPVHRLAHRVRPHRSPHPATVSHGSRTCTRTGSGIPSRSRRLQRLVGGYYQQAARLVTDTDTDGDAALALYLAKAGPLMVLRDLLDHSSVLTTEKYLRRLDMTRIYRDAYDRAGGDVGPAEQRAEQRAAQRETDAEFDEADD